MDGLDAQAAVDGRHDDGADHPGDVSRPRVSFRLAIWAMPIAFAVHEAEEWNILAWHRGRWVDTPAVTEVTVWTWLVFVSLLGFAWTLAASLPRNPRITAVAVLPFFVLLVLGNALQHVVLLAADGGYNPGVVTSVLGVIPSVVGVGALAWRRRLAPRGYLVALYLVAALQGAAILRAGDHFPAPLRAIYDLSAGMARAIFGHA